MFSIIKLPTSSQHARRTHTKSRHGCKTCKERKLKCDEAHPVCGNCSRRFVDPPECDYTTASKRKSGAGIRLEAGIESSHDPISTSTSDPIRHSRTPRGGMRDARLALPSELRAELLDPFLTYPASNVRGVDVLLRYYLQTAVYASFPWQPRSPTNPTTTYFVPLVLTDAVLFHATLQLSMLRCEKKAAEWRNVDSASLQGECIRLLRERVEVENDGFGKGVCDQTISAVVALAAFEHERDNLRMLRMHMDGLKRMVDIRGGLNAIRQTNAMVANSVFWIFVVAMYEIPYPAFDRNLPAFAPHEHNLHIPIVPERLDVHSHFSDIDPSLSVATTSRSTDMSIDLIAPDLANPVASVLISIQHVSHLVPTNDAYPTAATSSVVLTRMCTLLSHLLSLTPRDLQSSSVAPGAVQPSYLLSECTRLALLLHVFTPWRGLPPDGTLSMKLLLYQLITTLKDFLASSDYENRVLVLWIFAAGGVAAGCMPERKWFVGHLVEMVEAMGIESWEIWKAHLRNIVWHDNLCGPKYRALWDEIDAKRKELEEN
ncbi:hypothetical protein BKA65DRAFT_255223 [Rhexocercosporidium sp. MPI-PUGE-AT-0058]|nr:hypothetical protein BKA65DRAFT_255223 [Rhexocercosporidium sp. MPI-PUGE-AT-0058]